MSQRARRVSTLLKKEIAQIISNMSDPRLDLVTITGVKLSPDLRQATVYFLPVEESRGPEVKRGLDRARGFVRHELSRRVNLKFIPALSFEPDTALLLERRVQDLLRGLDEGSIRDA